MITLKIKKYFHSVLSIIEYLIEKGKIQLEIKKLDWELKIKFLELGKYATNKKETKSVIDFSHDATYLKQVNEIIKLKYYIEERLKKRNQIKNLIK